ncbi:MaoC family dehydratase N-terminal domain-containing protein [Myxococcota bacterium]|nr:MaoC family dehydratase N-terminal domain-containing protein [Myxococcota bacterium]
MTDPWKTPATGDESPTWVRTTGFANWNRYAAINDEFVPIHMDDEAARATGQPNAFGMGNLRLAYMHATLDNWLGDAGDIAELGCQFRGLNFKGDELTIRGTVTSSEPNADGLECVQLDLAADNQDGKNTAPGTATLVLFKDAQPQMPSPPPPPELDGSKETGVYLDEETLGWIGREMEPAESLPVGANEIRRWSMAVHYPERAPDRYYDEAVAARGPWGGLVAPRDFNPFAWMQDGAKRMPWMRTSGSEPGTRVLNGGQRNFYFERIRPGDVITATTTLADAYEREGRNGTMLFLITQRSWSNQRGELTRIGQMTTIYY